jgi:hypothetical protein
MEQFNVIFHTPADIDGPNPWEKMLEGKEDTENARKLNRAYETLRRVSHNAVSMTVMAEDIEAAVAKAHRCLGWGHYEHVTVINGLSVVAEYRHRVSVNQELDRII